MNLNERYFKNYVLISVLFVFSYNNVSSQEFNGTLKYVLTQKVSKERKDYYEVFGLYDFETELDDTFTITIHRDTFIRTSLSVNSAYIHVIKDIQKGDSAYVDFETFQVNFNSLFPGGYIYKYLGKGNKTKSILGYECKLYTYKFGENQIINAWIPDNHKFLDTVKYGKFFNQFFVPEGLIFAFTLVYSNPEDGDIENYWELVEFNPQH